jgi:site-specific DNA recombinase
MRVKQGPRRGGSPLYACVHDGCPLPTTVVMHRAQAAVLEWLGRYAREVEREASLAASERASRVTAQAAVTRLARAAAELDGELTRLTREFARGVIPQAAYQAARDELLAEQAAARSALDEAAARLEPSRPSRAAVAGLLEEWDTLSVAARNATLRNLLRVVVARGQRRSKVSVVPLWEWKSPARP